MLLRGTRTGNSVLSHISLKLDTAIGKPCGMRRDAQVNQIEFKRRLRRQVQVWEFQNILFANVNFEVFDAELRKWKQPDSDDDAN